MVTKKLGADIQITSAPNIPNGSVYLRCAKQLQQSIDYLHENDAKEYTKGDVQPHEGFPPEIDPIPMVDNLIAPVFVPFKHLRNVYAMLFEQCFFLLVIRIVLGFQLFDRLIIKLIRDDNILTITNCIFDGSYGIVGTLTDCFNGYHDFLQILNGCNKFFNDFFYIVHILGDLA